MRAGSQAAIFGSRQAPLTAIVTGAGGLLTGSLTSDATSLYWIDSTAGSIKKAPIGGGAISTLVAGVTIDPGMMGIAVDATLIYWSDPSVPAIRKAPIAGGAITTLVAVGAVGNSPRGVCVTAANVFWTDDNSARVGRATIAGATPTTIVATPLAGPALGIRASATNLYWADAVGRIVRSTLAGAAITSLATPNNPTDVAIDAAKFYTPAVLDADLERYAIAGGSELIVDASNVDFITPCGVTLDATYVYWTQDSVGTIWRLKR